jgi:broad specificity phosphatase PhoE
MRLKRALLPFLALTLLAPAVLEAQEAEPVVVVLVRHAEKADDDPRDPDLTPEGTARAELLARTLGDAAITAVWSSDLRRTRRTAEPVARAAGVEVRLYEPSGVEAQRALVDTLLHTPGRHLVVGHSNTLPALVRALGGDARGEIDDAEYDRLYVVTIGPDGAVSSTLLRFGPPPAGG